jgi:hypothetical protein
VKRLLLMAAVVGAALLGGLLLRAAGPVPGTARPTPAAEPQAVSEPIPAPTPVPPPARDVFRYDDEISLPRAQVTPQVARAVTAEPPPALQPPAPEPVRLVGFVRRAGGWHAALSIHGDVVVLGVGEASGGYEVVAIDEAEGVTVRDPQGQRRLLPLPER